MSGEFVLWDAMDSEMSPFRDAFPSSRWTDIAHLEVGWGNRPDAVYKYARYGIQVQPIPTNRVDIPPHIYFEIDAVPSPTEDQKKHLRNDPMLNKLVRPPYPWFQSKALCKKANEAWNLGQIWQAVQHQLAQGGISFEIYFRNGHRYG